MNQNGYHYGESGPAPEQEPARQFYYMEECRRIVTALAEEKKRPLTACVVTFGCQMNARDSEKLLGILKEIGFEESESEEADFVLYNTCTVRDNANQRVYGRLGHVHSMKKKNPDKLIALCGCMMQEKVVIDRIKESYRFVDLVFGTHNVYKLAELLYLRLTRPGMVIDVWKDAGPVVEELPVERKYFYKSGVNIMYGCDNFCTYCIVPYVRGREHSREPQEIVDEVRRLSEDGVIEVMLLGQNVDSYGNKGLKEKVSFAQLLEMVEQVEGIKRIRFMTSHPKDMSDELISVMAKSDKICRHIHLPVQCGSNRLLRKMNRGYTREQYFALVDRIRAAMPDISLTTDLIVGFPGETEEDFQETLDLVRRVRYDSCFTFLYSKRTGTPAASMPDQIPKEVAQDRFDRLLKEVQEIACERSGRDQGKVMDALVECEDDHQEGYVTGRLGNNIMVHFPGDKSLIGTIVPVWLKETKGFYYIGEMR